MADIPFHMLICIAASIEALFLVMGHLSESERRSSTSMDKFSAFPCSLKKIQLGIYLDTRQMMLALPKEGFCVFSTP